MDNLRQLLNNTLKIQNVKSQVSFMHARTLHYGKKAESMYVRSMNKILEKYVSEETPEFQPSINPEYLKKVNACLQQEGVSGRF